MLGSLSEDVIYYLFNVDNVNKTVQLAASLNALRGIPLTLVNGRSGTHTLITLGSETQVWSTNNGKVGDGTYLIWVEDVNEIAEIQGVRVELSGPGLAESLSYGPFRFKDLKDNVTKL